MMIKAIIEICVYVYIYTYMYTCIYIYIHIYIYVCLYVSCVCVSNTKHSSCSIQKEKAKKMFAEDYCKIKAVMIIAMLAVAEVRAVHQDIHSRESITCACINS